MAQESASDRELRQVVYEWLKSHFQSEGSPRYSVQTVLNMIVGNDYGGNDTFTAGSTGGAKIYFAGGGNDTVVGGSGDELILGDVGVRQSMHYPAYWKCALSGWEDNNHAAWRIDSNGGYVESKIWYKAEYYEYSTYLERLFILESGNDYLNGGAGNDTIYGGRGDDTLIGGRGNNHLDGGEGWDIADYSDSNTAINVNLATGVVIHDGNERDTIVGIEEIIGTQYADSIVGSDANEVFKIIQGGAGKYIDAGKGRDIVDYGDVRVFSIDFVNGIVQRDDGNGNIVTDTILGVETVYANGEVISIASETTAASAEAEQHSGTTIVGGMVDYSGSNAAVDVNLSTGIGNGGYAAGDTYLNIWDIIGSQYNDTITGNDADNSLVGGNGNDLLSGGIGNDVLNGGNGNDTLDGGVGDDLLLGGDGNDVLYGGDGNDTLDGQGGQDSLYGGAGDDVFICTPASEDYISGKDFIDGGDGFDIVDYSQASTRVSANLAAGTIQHHNANGGYMSYNWATVTSIEGVIGSRYDDKFSDNNEANLLIGGEGNDAFYLTGKGADTIDGGSGIDTVSYAYRNTEGVTVDLATGIGPDGSRLTGIEYLAGSLTGNNHLTASDVNTTLVGGNGADTLIGGAGNNHLLGGTGI